MKHSVILSAALAAGCTTNTSDVVEVKLDGSPTFIAYRNELGVWFTPGFYVGADGYQHYKLDVTGDYEVIVVCTRPNGSFYADELVGAYSDGQAVLDKWPTHACVESSAPALLSVTGQMNQAGRVFMGNSSQTSASQGWSYRLDVPVGVHDLVAMDGSRLLIRRDQNIDQSFVEPTVDVLSEGVPLSASTPFTLEGAEGYETVTTTATLFTRNFTPVPMWTAPSRVAVLANSQRVAGDTELVELEAFTSTSSRSASVLFTDALPSSFKLMPRLSGITFSPTEVAASWGVLPSVYSSLAFDYFDRNLQIVTVTKARADSLSSVAFDFAAPGYDAMWTTNPAIAMHSFVVRDNSTPVGYATRLHDPGVLAFRGSDWNGPDDRHYSRRVAQSHN